MKVAVVQHRIRPSASEDVAALVEAASRAADAGAEFVVMPEVASLAGETNPDRLALMAGLDAIEGSRLIPSVGPDAGGAYTVVTPPRQIGALGSIALFVGDACVDASSHQSMLAQSPDLAVLVPQSESELQAEAVLELAIGLSLSLAGLVVVVGCSGAEAGQPGHGGSAIVLLGEVLAEAIGDDDVLVAEVPLPVPQPEPREPLATVPPILQQRLAHHRGEKVPVDYPADLSS